MNDPRMSSEPNCSSPIRDDLKAYLDGELTPPARQRVQHHLRICADCAKELTLLQETQTRLREELPEVNPSEELRGRIRAQIDLAGIADNRVRRSGLGNGLIPRRWIPAIAVLSALVTVAALSPVFQTVREKARQASMRHDNRKQLGLAGMQYAQDYDEKFPVGASSKGAPSDWVDTRPYRVDARPARLISVTLQARQPDAVVDKVLGWEVSCEMNGNAGKEGSSSLILFTNGSETPRLLARLQKLGKINMREVQNARRVASAYPKENIELTVHILPETAR